MTLEEAQQSAKELVIWARERWGVKTEKKWQCPNSDGTHVYRSDYEGYCSEDGRKLKEIEVECQTQAWHWKLQDFIDLPEYPEEPKDTL